MRNNIATLCAACLTSVFFTPLAQGNPLGGSVVGGDGNATIAGQGTALTTINQNANRAIINWQDFSIGAGEITRFLQPSAAASALNRVLSGNPSQIYGSLQANGRVFVINPNGILVGPSGQIDTKGFFASTLDVPNGSFMAGANLTLSGNSTAAVRNQGSIRALGGDVFLIARTVENSGTIRAPQGTVGLGAGSEVRLVQSGNERLSVLAGHSSAPAADKGVNNLGTIEAASAELKAAGGNIYALAINNGGVVRATTVVNEGGHIYLRAAGGNIQNSGTLSASGANGKGGSVIVAGGHDAAKPSTVVNSGTIEARGNGAGAKGGDVKLLGDRVGLFDESLVDVSGNGGGGAALIGGDTHGANPRIQNAEATVVGPDSHIRADALTLGNGGKVVVWADGVDHFYGNISAQGAASGGNGGFVEVSGRNTLDFRGAVDTRASAGKAGTLLLDPATLNITQGATSGSQDGNLNTILAGGPDTGSGPTFNTVSQGALEAIANNNNVVLEATGLITIEDLSANGGTGFLNMQQSSGFSFRMTSTTSAGISFQNVNNEIRTAGGDIILQAQGSGGLNLGKLTSSGGAITLESAGSLTLNNNVNAAGGAVTLNNSGALTGAGQVQGTTLDLKGNGAVGTLGNPLSTKVSGIVLAKTGGNSFVSQDTATAVDLGGTTGGGDVTLTAGATTVNNADLDATVGGSVALNTTTLGVGKNVKGVTVTLNNSGALTGAGQVQGTTLDLKGNGAVGTLGNPLSTKVSGIVLAKTGGNSFVSQDTATAVDLGGTTGGGDVTLTAGATTVNNADLDATVGGSVALNTTTLGVGKNVKGVTVTLNNSGALTGAGQVQGTTLDLKGNGAVGTLGNPLSTKVSGIVLAKTGGNSFVSQDTATAVDLGGTTGGGDVTLTAGATTVNNADLDATVGGSVALNTTTLGVGKNMKGVTVTLNNSGALTGAGQVQGTTLDLKGNGAVGTLGNPLSTKVSGIVLAKTGGNSFVSQDTATAVDLGGTTGGGDVTLTAGATTVNNADLDATVGGSVALNTTTLGVGKNMKGVTVTLNNSGALTGAGQVQGTTLDLKGNGAVGTLGNPLSTKVSGIVLAKTGGNSFVSQDTATAVDLGGTTGGGDVTLTAGATTVNNADLDATVGGSVALNTTTLGVGKNMKGVTVTLNNSGALTGAGQVQGTTLDLKGNGAVGTLGNPLSTKVSGIVLAKTGGNSFVSQDTATAVDLGGTTGGGDVTLTAGATTVNNADLDATVGGSVALNTTTLGVGKNVKGVTVTLNNSGALTGAGQVQGTTLDLKGNGAVGTLGNPLSTKVSGIVLAKTGGNSFVSQDTATAVDLGGTTGGGDVTLTAGATTVNNADLDATVGGSVALNTTTLGVGKNVKGVTVTLNNSGALTGAGQVQGTTLDLKGNGAVGTLGNPLSTKVSGIVLAKTGGNSFVSQDTATAVDLGGTTGGGDVTLTAGATTVNNADLDATVGGSVALNTTTLGVGKNVKGVTVTLNNSGALTGAGQVQGTTLDLKGNGAVGTLGNPLSTKVSGIVLAKTGGNSFVSQDTATAVDLGGTTGGGDVTLTAGATTVNNADLDATVGGSVALNTTTLGVGKNVKGVTVTLNNSGALTGAGQVQGTTLDLKGNGAVGTLGNPLSTKVSGIVLAKTGGNSFVSQDTATAVDLGGTTGGGDVTLTAGATTVNNADLDATVGGSVALNTTTLGVGKNVKGVTVTLNNSGALTGAGQVQGTTLDLKGNGAVGTLGNPLSTKVSGIVLAKTGGNSFVSQDTATAVDLGGTTGGGDVTLTAGATTVNNADLDATVGGSVALNTTTLGVGKNVKGVTVTLNNSGALTGAGQVQGTTLDLKGNGAVGTLGNPLSTKVSGIVLAKTGGNSFVSQDTATAVDLGGTTGGGDVTLTAGATTVNNADLDATVGGSVALNTTTLGVGKNVKGVTVTLNNSGALTGAGQVQGTTLDLKGNGAVGTLGNPLSTKVSGIVLAKTGGNSFVSQDTATAVDLGGTTGGGDVTLTAGATTVNNADLDATVGGSVALNTTTLGVGKNVKGVTVTLNNSGALTGAGQVQGTTLDLKGNGAVGTLGNPLSTKVSGIVLAKTGGNSFVSQDTATAVDLGGTTGGGDVTLTAGATTVNNADLDATVGGSVALNTTTLGVGKNVKGVTVTLNNSGALTGAGQVQGTTLDLKGNGAVGTLGNPLSTKVSGIVLAKTGGNSFVSQDTATAVDLGGTTGGGDVTLTAGATTVNNADLDATVGGSVALNTTTLTASKTLSGATLRLNNSGLATLNGAVNLAGALTVNGSGTLAVNNTISAGSVSDSEATTLSAAGTTANATVKTTGGGQTYNGAVTLTKDTVVADTANGAIAFDSTVNGNQALEVNTAGVTTFNGAVGGGAALTSLTTDAAGAAAGSKGGNTALNATVRAGSVALNDATETLNAAGTTANPTVKTTGGGQTYNGAVTLTKDTVVADTANGAIAFDSTVNGNQALEVNTAGVTTFNGAVGGGAALTSLTTDAPGETDINGGAVTSTGAQDYKDKVVLTADTTLSGNTVTFEQTVDSDAVTARALAINDGGTTTFKGAVGGTHALKSLTTDAPGETDINGGAVTSTGAQDYKDKVVLTADTTLSGNTVTFEQTVDSDAVTARALAINDGGTTTFKGAVGGTHALKSLTTDAPGETDINGGAATSTGAQDYKDKVVLTADTTLSGNTVTFEQTVDSDAVTARALAINDGGTTTFKGAVGGTHALKSLTTDAPGETDINGGAVTSTGAQDYKDKVVLTADTTLSGNTVTFEQTVDSDAVTARALAINDGGTTTFKGAVGGTHALKSLTTDAPGETDINGGAVTSTGAQDYKDKVVLTADTTLSGNTVTFEQTVDSDAVTARALAINDGGTTTFKGAVGGTHALKILTTDAPGETDINGGAATSTGAQDYKDKVVLTADTTLSGNTVTFEQTVDSDAVTARALAINDGGTTTFKGAVGGTHALKILTTDAPGETDINGGRVNADNQDYKDAVTIGADTVLAKNNANNSAAVVNLERTVDGAHALTVDAVATTFGGIVGGTAPLTSLTTDAAGTTAINGGRVNANSQDYKDAVTIGADTVLAKNNANNSAAVVNLERTVDGAHALTVDAVATTFGGIVGGTAPLTSLTTDVAGTTAINGGRVNANSQDYKDPVTIGADTVLAKNNTAYPGDSATVVHLEQTVNGAHALTVDAVTATFDGDVGGATSLASFAVNSPSPVQINHNVRASSVALRSGTDGSGDMTFGPGVTVRADSQSYQAGDGTGGATAARVDLVGNAPTFKNTAGSVAPNTFTYRQDAAIGSGNVPGAPQFGGALPATFALQSDDGGVTLPAMVVPGTLDVTANGGSVTQVGNLSANNLVVSAVGPVTLGPGPSDSPSWAWMNQFNTVVGKVTGSGQSFSLIDQSALTVLAGGIHTANGNITLTADDMAISGPINSGTANTLLQPFTAGRNVSLGSEVSDALSLTQSELNQITANTLTIGNTLVNNLTGTGSIVQPGSIFQLVLIDRNGTITAASQELSGLLVGSILPVPKLEITSVSGSMSGGDPAKILPPGSIGVLFLQLPFVPTEEQIYKIENMSKWTSGRVTAAGSTTGPQSSR